MLEPRVDIRSGACAVGVVWAWSQGQDMEVVAAIIRLTFAVRQTSCLPTSKTQKLLNASKTSRGGACNRHPSKQGNVIDTVDFSFHFRAKSLSCHFYKTPPASNPAPPPYVCASLSATHVTARFEPWYVLTKSPVRKSHNRGWWSEQAVTR